MHGRQTQLVWADKSFDIILMSLLTILNKSSLMLYSLYCRPWTYISTDAAIKQKEHTW